MDKLTKRAQKKTGEELRAYLSFKRRGSVVPARKGKGSYDRAAFKAAVEGR